jgi:hypothetical protein
MGIGFLIIIVIVIGISMSAGTVGLQQVFPALLGFFEGYLIPFLLGIAFLIFVWNMIRFAVIGGATEEGRENTKTLILYSIGTFVFILAFWGILNIFVNGIGLDTCGNDLAPDYVGDDFFGRQPCGAHAPRAGF